MARKLGKTTYRIKYVQHDAALMIRLNGPQIRSKMAATAADIEVQMRRLLTGPERGSAHINHSDPTADVNFPIGIDTGELRNSVYSRSIAGRGGASYGWEIGSDTDYAANVAWNSSYGNRDFVTKAVKEAVKRSPWITPS